MNESELKSYSDTLTDIRKGDLSNDARDFSILATGLQLTADGRITN